MVLDLALTAFGAGDAHARQRQRLQRLAIGGTCPDSADVIFLLLLVGHMSYKNQEKDCLETRLRPSVGCNRASGIIRQPRTT